MSESEKLELASRRYLIEHGMQQTEDARSCIIAAMEDGMTWPIGCLGMPEGYVVGSSFASTATSGAKKKNTRRTKAARADSTTDATGVAPPTGENADV